MSKKEDRTRIFPTLYKKTANGKAQMWSIRVVPDDVMDTADIVVKFGLVDGEQQTQIETISEGKNRGKRNETSAFEQAVLEAAARYKKQRDRKHYGTSVEESAGKRASGPTRRCSPRSTRSTRRKSSGTVPWLSPS